MKNINNKGFIGIGIIIAIIAAFAVAGGFIYYSSRTSTPAPQNPAGNTYYPPASQTTSSFAENIVGEWISHFPSNPNDPDCKFAGDGDCTPDNGSKINFYIDHRFSNDNLPKDSNCTWSIEKDIVKIECPLGIDYPHNPFRIISLTKDKLIFVDAEYTQQTDGSFVQTGYQTEQRTFLRNK